MSFGGLIHRRVNLLGYLRNLGTFSENFTILSSKYQNDLANCSTCPLTLTFYQQLFIIRGVSITLSESGSMY